MCNVPQVLVFIALEAQKFGPYIVWSLTLASAFTTLSLGYINNAIIMNNERRVMSELTVNYHNCELSILMSRTDSEEDNEKVRVEDWRWIISNSAIRFSDFVNADKTAVTMATINIEELWRATLLPHGERKSWSHITNKATISPQLF